MTTYNKIFLRKKRVIFFVVVGAGFLITQRPQISVVARTVKRRHPLAIPIIRYHGRLGCLIRKFIDTSKFFRLTGLGFNSVLPFEFPLNFSSTNRREKIHVKNFDEKQAAIYCGPA